MRTYNFLSAEYSHNNYTLVPLRHEDRWEIMEWRNKQLDILRQNEPLTREQQDLYFNTVIASLFEKEQPEQILWSFLYNGNLIGYGGLVHIDWNARHGEISFVLCNHRNEDIDKFKTDWFNYLAMLEKIAFSELRFSKIYTYAYNIRDYYFEVMYKLGYELEARLKKHVIVRGKAVDVLILSKFMSAIA